MKWVFEYQNLLLFKLQNAHIHTPHTHTHIHIHTLVCFEGEEEDMKADDGLRLELEECVRMQWRTSSHRGERQRRAMERKKKQPNPNLQRLPLHANLIAFTHLSRPPTCGSGWLRRMEAASRAGSGSHA